MKDAALLVMADALLAGEQQILAANAADVSRARDNGTYAALIDRLTLTRAFKRGGWRAGVRPMTTGW